MNDEAPARCSLCGTLLSDHEYSNHEFTLTGQLIPKRQPSSRQTQIRYVKTADTELRALLIGKGIISADDLKLLPTREEENANQDSGKAAQPN